MSGDVPVQDPVQYSVLQSYEGQRAEQWDPPRPGGPAPPALELEEEPEGDQKYDGHQENAHLFTRLLIPLSKYKY